ncbi:MAG TPA: hypothetical protein VHK47_09750 [Polyangia bacterium]|jgi:flagellar motor protein MotB|nr:hypothetical protein [Polyangia bacterium]
MARSAFDSMDVPPTRSGSSGSSGSSGWKAMLWFAVAAAGVGFAGYVFLVPYQKMQSALGVRTQERDLAQASLTETTAERDKLKATLGKYTDAEKEKAAAEAKRKADADALLTALRPSLEPLGATITAEGAGSPLVVSFPADKIIDANGIDVSDGGVAAVKILADNLKKASAKARVVARASSAPPPKELKSLFHSAGELQAVRAARVMSALEDAGLPATAVSIVGEAEKPAPAHARGKKAAPVVDHVDVQVEPL